MKRLTVAERRRRSNCIELAIAANASSSEDLDIVAEAQRIYDWISGTERPKPVLVTNKGMQ